MSNEFNSVVTKTIEACSIIEGQERQKETLILRNTTPVFWQENNSGYLEDGYWLRMFFPVQTNDNIGLTLEYNKEACATCNACKPSRIQIANFCPTESQKELISSTNLTVSFPAEPNPIEHRSLAFRYTNSRHPVLDLDEHDSYVYWHLRQSLSACMEFRNPDKELVAAILFQISDKAVAGDYYYYDTSKLNEYRNLSLYLKLQLVMHLKNTAAEFLYMGAWTETPSKLTPKARLKGLEILEDGTWKPLSKKQRGHAMSEYFKNFPPEISGPT